MNPVEASNQHFSTGKNCAQSVLMAFAEELNLNPEQALKLTTGFGGGIAHNGKVCGAVTGAIMVLGMKHSSTGQDAVQAKELTFEKVNEFLEVFKKKHGSIDCKDLIEGIDLMTEEGRTEAKNRNTHDKICLPIVESAAEIILNLQKSMFLESS